MLSPEQLLTLAHSDIERIRLWAIEQLGGMQRVAELERTTPPAPSWQQPKRSRYRKGYGRGHE